ncbi:WAP domain containing protein, SLPI-like [Trichuris trichiura]|uniref:WAP domain containing protein, SLPI-like n=1 Tax=Trichuris trichiura TaxID=36087 RepID=A0A077Z4C2_TRITR|nr:WAP domain containing protein, SLPI-like [Trichuris trichiura]
MHLQWAALLAFLSQITFLKGMITMDNAETSQFKKISGQKPGECPIIVGGTRTSTPINRCEDDNQCPGKRKCCDTLIGTACMLPETSDLQTTTVTTLSHIRYPTSTSARPKPTQECNGEGEEYSECAPLCPKGCDNMHKKPTCSGCKPGCKCKRGFHRLAVDDSSSPCVRNAVCEAMTSKENCPDGSIPTSVCRGKHKSCPKGTRCTNGLCCPLNANPPSPPTTTARPGQCPENLIYNFAKWPSCTQDSDCPSSQKCCATMYSGKVCIAIISGIGKDGKKRPLETVMKLLGLEQVMNILQ